MTRPVTWSSIVMPYLRSGRRRQGTLSEHGPCCKSDVPNALNLTKPAGRLHQLQGITCVLMPIQTASKTAERSPGSMMKYTWSGDSARTLIWLRQAHSLSSPGLVSRKLHPSSCSWLNSHQPDLHSHSKTACFSGSASSLELIGATTMLRLTSRALIPSAAC